MTGNPSPYCPAKLNINLEAIRKNFKLLQASATGEAVVASVVKTDAYGLGAAQIVPELMFEGCRDFFVACLHEAVELRRIDPFIRIYVLNGVFKGHEKAYPEHNLIPVVNSLEELERYGEFARIVEKKLPIVLHFDTGINRLGIRMDEAEGLSVGARALAPFELKMIMSHFACADVVGDEKTPKQYEAFLKICERFPGVPRSISNSAGMFVSRSYHFEYLRPGMALYGLNPKPGEKNPMQSVVTAAAPILQLKKVKADETIGYGATYKFERDADVAVLALGYGDGLLCSLANKGGLYWQGFRCDIRGRVSMDLVAVELSELPEYDRPEIGDYMEVLGPNQSADNLAEDAGTIGYEILCALGHRYHKVYDRSAYSEDQDMNIVSGTKVVKIPS